MWLFLILKLYESRLVFYDQPISTHFGSAIVDDIAIATIRQASDDIDLWVFRLEVDVYIH